MGNKYNIKRKLGEGGFGIVYLVEKDNKDFALKQCKIKLTKEEIEQYKTKINTLSKINNEYLIKYYETFMENDILNILMEYAGEKNLKQFIEDYKNKGELIDEKIIKNIIIQICRGLKEIHDKKIIHRDLTPDNIFIDDKKKIKIGDFGISTITTTYNRYANTRIGKSHYLAPEIERGLEYNNKVDIYSLGCVIYELFTLNEYYIDKVIEEKDCKINIDIYNSKYQKLIDLLLRKDYHERPNIEEVINKIDLIYNYIIAELNIEEKDINKDIRIINSYEEYIRSNNLKIKKDEFDKYKNEKEIKDNCQIEINNNVIDFNYFYNFKEKGKYNIKYIFNNHIIKADYLFSNCKSLINIDLSNFKTKKVNDMSYMCSWCESLIDINLNNFYSNLVTDISYMFFWCESLTNIDLSNFNSHNVTNMSYMFGGCESLKNINITNFDTQNVNNMSHMFSWCKSLTNIDLSNFNTQSVSDMSYMFEGCESLANIDLSNFNTKNVSDMSYMFEGCVSLTNLDLSNFNTQNVSDMSYIFSWCESLKKEFFYTKDKNILKEFDYIIY